MKNQFILWSVSIIVTFLIGYFKSVTDINYPLTGTFGIEGKKVSYKLDKVFYGNDSYKNIIISDVKGVIGKVVLRKNNIQSEIKMTEIDKGLLGEIPSTIPGEKIDYKIILTFGNKTYHIPEADFVTLTFWGNIPDGIKTLFYFFLYGGLLMLVRCLLELFNKNIYLKKYAFITSIFFIILALMITPLYNSYKIGAINNFVPPIKDLFEPILIIVTGLWITGTVLIFLKKFVVYITIILCFASISLFYFLKSG